MLKSIRSVRFGLAFFYSPLGPNICEPLLLSSGQRGHSPRKKLQVVAQFGGRKSPRARLPVFGGHFSWAATFFRKDELAYGLE